VNELVAGATQRQQTVIYGRQRASKQAPDCTQSAAAAAAGKPVRRPPPSTSTRNHPRNLTQIGLYRRGEAAATAAGVAWRGVAAAGVPSDRQRSRHVGGGGRQR